MKIFRSLNAVPALPRKTALAIGNFDGLHLGHQKILKFLADEAGEKFLFSCVLTFSPHPEKIFGPKNIWMIQTLAQRLEEIEKFSPDMILVVPFDRQFAGLGGKDFVQEILVKTLRAGTVIVGSGFRFGKDRLGDVRSLRRFGRQFGFDVEAIAPVKRNGLMVSSSLIRDLLQQGRIGAANLLLGRPYSIEGDVERGDARGRRLGFPTANIQTPNEIIPSGVYVTIVEMGDKRYPSITNAGVRPTFQEYRGHQARTRPRFSIETHILDFRKNIYGTSVKIHFLKKIREEREFGDAQELAARIRKDLESARQYYKKTGTRHLIQN
jgi:riboflavin kinase/FMN adenylyltransferase